jgi:hypothetical protein
VRRGSVVARAWTVARTMFRRRLGGRGRPDVVTPSEGGADVGCTNAARLAAKR